MAERTERERAILKGWGFQFCPDLNVTPLGEYDRSTGEPMFWSFKKDRWVKGKEAKET